MTSDARTARRAENGPSDLRGPVFGCHALSKRLGGRQVVDRVSFQVRPGQIHGLLGPNGAGKTTTLRMLLGLVRPDAGTVDVDSVPIDPMAPRGRCGVAGFVEAPTFYPYLTASRNLELLSAWDGPVAHRRVEELLDLVGLTGRAQSKVRGFSTGMRQRLGVAAALISDPDVLIVDEPSTGLDPAGIRDLHAVLREIAESGRSVLLSSHDLDEVEQLCTDVTVLRAGTVAYDGALSTLLAQTPHRRWRLDSSNNSGAVAVAATRSEVRVWPAEDGDELVVESHGADLDPLVIALAANGIAVRHLQRQALGFESLFLQLTGDPDRCPDAAASRCD